MHPRYISRTIVAVLGALAWVGLTALPVQAVPSYARQTGVSCAACHTSYPELTPFGRLFKLNGYVQSIEPQIGGESQNVSINQYLPISAMVTITYSQLDRADFDRTPGLDHVRNEGDMVLFPQEFSLFYAGRITPYMGTFLQVTYDGQGDAFSMDNVDIRLADHVSVGGSNLVYGATLNNNPTVQDLWNTIPAWGFPFSKSGLTPDSVRSIQLDGQLGQQVAGLGGYVGLQKESWLLYGELTFYKSAFLGKPSANGKPGEGTSSQGQNVIQNAAPYVRLAAEKSFGSSAWQFGGLWLDATYVPYADVQRDTVVGGPRDPGVCPTCGLTHLSTNHFTDYGVDSQYQFLDNDDQVTVKGIWLHEDHHWGSLSAPVHSKDTTTLDTYRVTGSYLRNRKYGFSVQSFSTTGSKDLAYSGTGSCIADPTAVDPQTSRTCSPDTSGNIVELVYTPYLNTRFSLSYTMFDTFNGSAMNYDNQGRNAADNNTLYLLAWLMF